MLWKRSRGSSEGKLSQGVYTVGKRSEHLHSRLLVCSVLGPRIHFLRQDILKDSGDTASDELIKHRYGWNDKMHPLCERRQLTWRVYYNQIIEASGLSCTGSAGLWHICVPHVASYPHHQISPQGPGHSWGEVGFWLQLPVSTPGVLPPPGSPWGNPPVSTGQRDCWGEHCVFWPPVVISAASLMAQ